MSKGPSTFKQTDVSRLYKAAIAGGMPDPQIELDQKHKKIIVRSGAPAENGNDLDRELADFQARHGEG